MVRPKKKSKICDKGSEEDRISQLPDALISDILVHLPTKDAVRTSVLSTRWRSLWQCVPGLDFNFGEVYKVDGFLSFAERFFDSRRDSLILKLRLRFRDSDANSFLTPWIHDATMLRLQHLDVHIESYYLEPHSGTHEIPLSIYTCKTLVHLRLFGVTLDNAEFVSLPCLEIMHLEKVRYLNEATLEKLISGSPVLEDLTIVISSLDDGGRKVLRVSSQTLKRIDVRGCTEVVIDAPLLKCYKTSVSSHENFKIINLGISTKLDIDVGFTKRRYSRSFVSDFLTSISEVKNLVIRTIDWKYLFLSPKPGTFLQFSSLSRLNARYSSWDFDMLPIILECCRKLESLTLELVMGRKNNRIPKVTFSAVPRCLVSSLKFIELKGSTKAYEEEMELLRYILKNSTILEKLKLDVYYAKKAKCAFLTQLAAMPRSYSACEVIVV